MNPLLSDALLLMRTARSAVRSRPILFFAVLPLLAIAAVFLFFPHDVTISNLVVQDRSEFMRDVARRFSAYLDFRLAVEFFIVFLALGLWKKRRDWQRLAIAVLIATSLAGAFDTSIRVATGRPRPHMRMPDHFTGLQLSDHHMQSFPSAHSATSMATAAVIAVALPEIGIPFLILSLGVPWARLFMHDHYVSDITVGGLIGLWFGLAFGLALRRLNASD